MDTKYHIKLTVEYLTGGHLNFIRVFLPNLLRTLLHGLLMFRSARSTARAATGFRRAVGN